MATELLVALGSVFVAVIGAVSGVLALLANRKKLSSETHENDATAAEIITRAAGAAVQMQIAAAESACKELIRQAIEESEARCRQQMAEQEARHHQEIADQGQRYSKEINDLREWGQQLSTESCEARKQMQAEIDGLRQEVAVYRDAQMADLEVE